MSSKMTVTVTCPKCKGEHPFVIWKSINTQIDSEMRAAVKDGSLFMFECPECGKKTNVDYGILYHQMEDGMMIYYADTDETAKDMLDMLRKEDWGEMSAIHGMLKDNYMIRIVRSQNELREKINIFDAGLDDRIVEIIKLFLLYNFLQSHPGHKSVNMYFRQGESENVIEMFADDQPIGHYKIPEGLYEDICKQYEGKIPDVRKAEPFIDRNWAMQHLNPDGNEERSTQ